MVYSDSPLTNLYLLFHNFRAAMAFPLAGAVMVRSIVNSAPLILVTALHEAVYLGLTYACVSAIAACLSAARES
jgi:hypothetical protein